MKYAYTALAALILFSILPNASAQPPEFRGVWVHNWLPGLLSPSEVDETVRWAKDSNANALVVQVKGCDVALSPEVAASICVERAQ